MRDLREWVRRLGAAGELVEVHAQVDPYLEITEIADRVMKAGGPALLFRNVTGSDLPVLINQFGSERRMSMALGGGDLDSIAARIAEIAEMQPPQGLADAFRALGTLKDLASLRTKSVRSGPCQEVVLRGDDVDLDRLPILTCWPDDGGPFVTLPLVFSHNPRTGVRNCGMYRVQKVDRQTCIMHWQVHKDGRQHLLDSEGRIPVAVAIGTDPAVTYSATAPLPPAIDEMMFAGFLRGERVEMVRAVTQDIEVPANAEVVLEGYVDANDIRDEGPFGDHTGFYTPVDQYPAFHVTALTMRRDAIYSTTIVGMPPMEDFWLGKATERLFLPLIRMMVPDLVDMNLPLEGVFHNCAIVSVKKRYPGHAKTLINAVWGLGLLSLTRCVIVVDAAIDVHDVSQVAFRALSNVDARRDVLVVDGPVDALDHAAPYAAYGAKIGFDATAKWEGEGHVRPWPDEIRMSDEVRESVSARWAELGITLPGA